MATETEMLEQVARALGVDEVPDRLKSTLLRKVITAQGGSCDDLPDNLQSTLLERLAENCGTVNIIDSESPTKDMLGSFAQLGKVRFKNCTTIGGFSVFEGCTSLTGVDLPDCTIITGGSTFTDCTSLVNVNLPKCTRLPGGVFSRCSALRNVNVPKCEYVDSSCFSSAGIESIVFPNLTGMGYGVFGGTTNLKRIDFHKTVKLNSGTFSTSSVETVIMRDKDGVSEIDSYAFSGATGNYFIYVPAALKAQYEAAANGMDFANRFRAIEDYPAICG